MIETFQDPADAEESRLVWDYFKKKTLGVFVECGANHPVHFNQSWFLKKQGWNYCKHRRPCRSWLQARSENGLQ
jgi:hypothetical protein